MAHGSRWVWVLFLAVSLSLSGLVLVVVGVSASVASYGTPRDPEQAYRGLDHRPFERCQEADIYYMVMEACDCSLRDARGEGLGKEDFGEASPETSGLIG